MLSESGVRHSFVTNSDNKAFVRQFTERGISPEVIVYEAGLTGFVLYRACESAGLRGMVVAANKIPKPACQGAKTDLIDCRRLVELAAKDELRGNYIPTEEAEADRSLARRREDLARSLSKIKGQIKSFLTCHGLPIPGGWGRKDVAQLASDIQRSLGGTLRSLLSELEYFDKEKRQVSSELARTVLPPPAEDVLRSVPGVGVVTSGAFRTEIIDPRRFESGEQLASFVGLAPMVRQSGESRGQSRLSKSGQGALRSKLIEAAWTLRKKEKWASDLYKRIYSRCGKCQKAITALARKLAVILWRLWLENRLYDPSYQNAVPSEA